MAKTKHLAALSALALVTVAQAGEIKASRVFREPILTRGNLNILREQAIEDAKWIWAKDLDRGFARFRNRFTVAKDEGPLTIDVSADERFYLTCDGKFVARGPNRGTVENWQYQTYQLDLEPGEHVFECVVWRLDWEAPLAQHSQSAGFTLKAGGTFDERLTTGRGKWEVGRLTNMKTAGGDAGVWGTGSQFTIEGRGPFAAEPAEWEEPVVVRDEAGRPNAKSSWGTRCGGWMLYPAQLPDQTETPCAPGRVVAVVAGGEWRGTNSFDAASTKAPEVTALNDLIQKGKPFTVPAHTRLQAAWDLGRYYCAYPLVTLAGGKGGRAALCWTESSRGKDDALKGDRNAIVGKYLEGYGDNFICDGRRGEFSSPWFRCGKWVRVDLEAGDEPLTVERLGLIESRYPLEMESDFSSPDDPSLADVRRIAARSMQMCCHEMLFDCPYYEQQMYPGDSRVQLQVLSAMTRDDRIIRRAIEIYDLATRDNGMCPMNWPTRMLQESASYTLCYLCMYGDYVMNHANPEWLRARLPGLRKSMAGIEYYENRDGLLEDLPGWNFMDWTVGWRMDGTVPGMYVGEGPSAIINLFWAMAMDSTANVETILDHPLQAQYWREKSAALKAKIVERFWVEKRGLLADSSRLDSFSEHAQALALLTDALPADKAKTVANHLVSDSDLARCTVYFSYYLFDAYFKIGRADLFQRRLDLWRGYVAKGLTTCLESPDTKDANGKVVEARSDCHAWGAHPIWFMQTGLAGIRSAAPFFRQVRVAPQPGTLKSLKARHPHPDGWIEVELAFADGQATGTIRTPVPGTFAFGGREIKLQPGKNTIK